MTRPAGLTIREVAANTGIAAGTLRAWETRYGFPRPERLASGHRRYSVDECDRVAQVAEDRRAGLSLQAAIARALRESTDPDPSIFAGLRRRRPDVTPYLLPKRTLIALSHAIEDECAARAERPILFGSFQREKFFRDAEPRWRELSRTAEIAIAFADFEKVAPGNGGPMEVPLEMSDALMREWSLVCEAPDYSACLSAWERPGQHGVSDFERLFETIWTVEPELVREAVQIGVGLASRVVPEVAQQIAARIAEPPPPSSEQLRLIGALASRMVAYVGGSAAPTLPRPHT